MGLDVQHKVGIFLRVCAQRMFGSSGTVNSKIYISPPLVTTKSGLRGVAHRWGGMVPTPGREKGGMSALNEHFAISIELQIYLSILSCRHVNLPWLRETLQ